MSETNRRRLRRVGERIKNRGWETVLTTEVRAREAGVIWLGDDEDQMAVVHSKRAAVVLRGDALARWKDDGQQKRMEDRIVTVVLESLRLVCTNPAGK